MSKGLQRRDARDLFTTGEFFLQFRPSRAEDRLTVPLQIRMLPSEMRPLSCNSADAKAVAHTKRCEITSWIGTRPS